MSGPPQSASTRHTLTCGARQADGSQGRRYDEAAGVCCLSQQKEALNIPTCNLRGARMTAGVKRG